MSFLRSLAVVLIIAVVIAAVGGHRFLTENRFAAEQVVQDSFDVTSPPRIIVETFNGSVEVLTTAQDRVDARVTRRATGSSEEAAEEALSEIRITMDRSGDTIHIAARRSEELWHTGNRSAAVLLEVPERTSVEVRTSNGPVDVVGLTNEVQATTTNGQIQVNGSRGRLKLNSSNGNLKVIGGRDQVELRTSNGKIEVKGAEAVVHARTSNGAIHFEGRLTDGEHLFQSSNGKLTVALPPESEFQVDARTSNGKISSDFKVKLAGKPQKRRLIGQVGSNPYFTLKLETSNGNVELHKE